MPGTQLAVNLASQVGQPYDEQKVTRDVHYLWNLGRFDDVRVERPDPDVLVFRVKPRPHLLLHEIWLEPNTFGLTLKMPQGTPLDLVSAHELAKQASLQLQSRGYANPRIREEIVPRGHGMADLHLHVSPGDDLRVKRVNFEGDNRFKGQLHALRATTLLPHVWLFPGWHLLAGYNDDAVNADIARVQSAYLRKGYLEARVVPGEVRTKGQDVQVGIIAEPGPQSTVSPDLCKAVLVERRDAQKEGILDFTARYDTERGLTVKRGPSYRVGRIEFYGNHHYSDITLRKNMVLDEGAVLDELLLRRSVARLNRSGMFDPIDEKHVVVRPNPETGYADIAIQVAERKRGAWNISGPVGPMSIAGPLQASISSKLPGWPGYVFSIGMFAFGKPLLPIVNAFPRFMPIFALERPFNPGEGWKSGFVIAPQLGWPANVLGYAVAQLQGRLMPLLSGERSAQPVLPVTVTRPEGETTLYCEPPKPRLHVLRTGAGVALNFLGALPMM